MTPTEFEKWWGKPIRTLLDQKNNDDLIAALMLALPVVEAIIRARTRFNKTSGFMNENAHRKEFLDLTSNTGFSGDGDSNVTAWWGVFRNGFLHRLDFSDVTSGGNSRPSGWINHDLNESIAFGANRAVCNPRKFCEELLGKIGGDSSLLNGIDAPNVGEPKAAPNTPGMSQQTFLDKGGGDVTVAAATPLTSSLAPKP